MGGHEGRGCDLVGRQSGSAVETEPAEPEQTGSQHGERQIMGHKTRASVPAPVADHQDTGKGRGAAGRMNHQAAGEIKHAHTAEPAAFAPYPMTYRVVDEHRPENGEHEKRHEPHPLREGTGYQGRGDHREHTLIDHEHGLGDRGGIIGAGRVRDTVQGKPGQIADKASHIRAEGHRIPDIDPLQGDERDQKKALHNGTENIFPSHHAAVKQGKPRRHQHYKASRCKNKSSIRTIHFTPPETIFGNGPSLPTPT